MKIPKFTVRRIIATMILLGGIVCLSILTSGLWRGSSDQHPAQNTTDVKSESNKTVANAQTNSAPTSAPAAGPADIVSSSPACKQFTLPIAKAILGADAALISSDSVIIAETDDMLTSSCVYHTPGSDTIRLSAYFAKTALGESTNTTMFGSEKPAGVTDIPGYGQAAYWDAHSGILSILKNNNRYDLSRNTNDLGAVLRAADSIVPKL